MSKNRTGGIKGNKERGNKARKQEDSDRGLNNSARRDTIQDQIDSNQEGN